MRKVEAQAFAGDIGAHLAHMLAQHLAQRLLQQVGGGVQAGGVFGMVGQPALEFRVQCLARAGAVLLVAGVKPSSSTRSPCSPASSLVSSSGKP